VLEGCEEEDFICTNDTTAGPSGFCFCSSVGVSSLCDVIADDVVIESDPTSTVEACGRAYFVCACMSLPFVGLGSDLAARYRFATPRLILSVIA
jgi:hypothetical protein